MNYFVQFFTTFLCILYCFDPKISVISVMVALFVCKCLNVALESDKVEDNIDVGKLELTPTEQRDIFFSEKLVSCASGSLKSQVAQPALLGQRMVGRWQINSCLACSQNTHAVLPDRSNLVLICKSIHTTPERVNSLKRSKNFSTVFNLLVPEFTNDIEMKENVDTTNLISSERKSLPAPQQVIGSLNKQLTQNLQSQLEAVEEAVRQFREQKYAEYEAFRERAHRDHKILASIISKARHNSDSEARAADNGPPSPQLPPLQRRRLSSFKDAKKLSQVKQPNRHHVPPEEDSLEPEDIFDLEGTDSRHMVSDQDDYDSDQGSNDEGIAIGRGRRGAGGQSAADIARSLPINMPNMPDRPQHSDLEDDEEPQDIAASIKALARSVHGDPFELPRPRFSTQI